MKNLMSRDLSLLKIGLPSSAGHRRDCSFSLKLFIAFAYALTLSKLPSLSYKSGSISSSPCPSGPSACYIKSQGQFTPIKVAQLAQSSSNVRDDRRIGDGGT